MVPLGELRLLNDPEELAILNKAKQDQFSARVYADWLRDRGRDEEADIWAEG